MHGLINHFEQFLFTVFGLQIPVPPSAQPSRQELVRIIMIGSAYYIYMYMHTILCSEFTCACKFLRDPIFTGTRSVLGKCPLPGKYPSITF